MPSSKKTAKKAPPEYWLQVDKPLKRLKAEFLTLLDEDLPEQDYQAYIEQNTRLVPREFVQNHGIHFNLVLRKTGLWSRLQI